jgi:hypothetical protein
VHEEANECTPFGKIGYHKTLVLDPISSDANIQNIKYDSKRERLGPGQVTILYRAGYFLTWSGGQTGHLSSRVGALEHLFMLRRLCFGAYTPQSFSRLLLDSEWAHTPNNECLERSRKRIELFWFVRTRIDPAKAPSLIASQIAQLKVVGKSHVQTATALQIENKCCQKSTIEDGAAWIRRAGLFEFHEKRRFKRLARRELFSG